MDSPHLLWLWCYYFFSYVKSDWSSWNNSCCRFSILSSWKGENYFPHEHLDERLPPLMLVFPQPSWQRHSFLCPWKRQTTRTVQRMNGWNISNAEFKKGSYLCRWNPLQKTFHYHGYERLLTGSFVRILPKRVFTFLHDIRVPFSTIPRKGKTNQACSRKQKFPCLNIWTRRVCCLQVQWPVIGIASKQWAFIKVAITATMCFLTKKQKEVSKAT